MDLDPLQQYAATTNSIVKRQACSLAITRPGAIFTVKFLPLTQELKNLAVLYPILSNKRAATWSTRFDAVKKKNVGVNGSV